VTRADLRRYPGVLTDTAASEGRLRRGHGRTTGVIRGVVMISVTIPRRSGGMLAQQSWHPALRRRLVTTGSGGGRVWVLWGLVLALLGATVALWVVNDAARPQSMSPLPLLVPGFATVGAIVVARHRGHVIGWLFLGLAAVTAVGSFCEAYAIRRS
jgi:hypothetical protein